MSKHKINQKINLKGMIVTRMITNDQFLKREWNKRFNLDTQIRLFFILK